MNDREYSGPRSPSPEEQDPERTEEGLAHSRPGTEDGGDAEDVPGAI